MSEVAELQDSLAPSAPLENRRQWTFLQRHGLLLVGISPIIACLIGSVFNILFNQTQIEPMLSKTQLDRFHACWQVYNLVVYPLAIGCWMLPLLWLRPIHRDLIRGADVDSEKLQTAQRYVVNLPWWFTAVACVGWLSCIPVFPAVLSAGTEVLRSEVVWQLIASFVTASSIAITHSFFAVEISSQKTLYPVFFRKENPADVPGAVPLGIVSRAMLWVVSAVISPVVSLLLLIMIPHANEKWPLFAGAVAIVAILFAITTGWMLGRLVALPVRQLRRAATRIEEGDLNVRVNLLRADDFGPLIERFNVMVEGLREKEHLQETFGCHVGKEAARQILAQDGGLVGQEQIISVMFVDVRNFTAHSSNHTPQEVVTALNVFFTRAVEIIESHGGMVNKFLGDGFMALFGIGALADNHAQRAVEAGQALLQCLAAACQELEAAGWCNFQIGIGVNTGPAIVGSIGSPKRQEYTAIGDTVNVAARVEALTKNLGHLFLVTKATREHLSGQFTLQSLPPQEVKGKGKLRVFAVEESLEAGAVR